MEIFECENSSMRQPGSVGGCITGAAGLSRMSSGGVLATGIGLPIAGRHALGIARLDLMDGRRGRAGAAEAVIAGRDVSLQETLLAHERLARDLKLAEQVQHQFLPQSLPAIAGYAFFAYYHAAHEVGGDYYDFVPLLNGRLGIALGDVSGKGVAAALVMAKFSGDTRLKLQSEGSPSAAAAALNHALCDAAIDERYITLSLSILEASTGRLQLCSAGHPPMLLRRADGTVEAVGEPGRGLPLGIVRDTVYEQVEVLLRPGDVAVVYSDGVTDARSPTETLFDTRENRRLLQCIQAADGGPEAVGWAILREVDEFSRGHAQADDLTLVCFGPAGQ